ncbi:MAG TPA: DUF4160 domain-containing protein [Pirellulaceae bacterium]|jgi:hypothetical protein
MAEISRFFGIVIHMFSERGSPHHRPHLHAKYQEFRAVLALDNIEVLAGQLPPRQERLLLGWAELHQEELLAAWQIAISGTSPPSVEPLK